MAPQAGERNSPRVLVTGAGGFLGRTVCADLLAHGFAVRAMRRWHVPPAATSVRAESVVADLDDPASLRLAMDGVDAVVHLAARVHVMRERASNPLALYRKTNVEGTRALLDAAKGAGARRFIFISSVKAVGETSNAPFTSATPAAPRDPYGVSKLEAEATVCAAGRAGSLLSTTVLRLPLVYGPHMGGNMLRLFDIVNSRIPTPLPRVNNARSMVYSCNAAAAIRHVLGLSSPPAGPLFVSDARDVSTTDLLRLIGAALGGTARFVPMPQSVVALATRLARAASAVGIHGPEQAVNRLFGNLQVDAREVRERAGFVPPYALDEGLRQTAEWYLASRARAVI